jgi:methyltransferase (TIGR00027 family)
MAARPSRTALKIARFMVLIDAVPRFAGLLPHGAAATAEAILRASGAVPARRIDVLRKPWLLRFYAGAEALFGRGQLLWFGLRKRYMADAVVAAIADGARQLLVVGAGLDPLASAIARAHPNVLCIEIDAPATATAKVAGIAGAGVGATNLHVCAADLAREPLAQVLATTPWDRGARSVVVAEGLVMYLDARAVARFLAAVRECCGPQTRLALSSVDGDEQQRPRLHVLGDWPVRLALRLAGEPMLWGVAPAALAGAVGSAGWRVHDQPDLAELRRRYLAPLGLHGEPVAPYEHLAVLVSE